MLHKMLFVFLVGGSMVLISLGLPMLCEKSTGVPRWAWVISLMGLLVGGLLILGSISWAISNS